LKQQNSKIQDYSQKFEDMLNKLKNFEIQKNQNPATESTPNIDL